MDPSGTVTPAVASTTAENPSQSIQVGYDSSISGDIAAFEGSLRAAEQAQANSVMKSVLEPLDFINKEQAEMVQYAEKASASGNELTPSEIVMLTAKSQEFMFYSQLTSNVANRTADGLSQLFRQQS